MRLIVGGTYGYTRDGGKQFHGGVDLFAPEGTEVFSVYSGCVEWVEDFEKGWGLAALCRIDFPHWSCWSLYAHLSDVFLKKGTTLDPGTLIGLTGVSGNGDVNYPHLHFEIWRSLEAGRRGTRERFRLNPLDILGPLPLQSFANEVIDSSEKHRNLA